MVDKEIGIGCFTETWFSSLSNSTTAIIKDAGFDIVHCYREKRGGGVAVIWNTRLEKQIKISPISDSFETFQFQNVVFQGKFKMNILCIYRLQETPFKLFIEELNNLISQQIAHRPLLLTGDFNVHFEKTDLSDVKSLMYLASSFGLTQFVVGPTHKLGHTLDLVFANSHVFEMDKIESQCYDVSDHFPVFFKLPNTEKQTFDRKKVITYRDINSIDMSNFGSTISSSVSDAFADVEENTTFSNMCELYTNTVECELDRVAPWKTRSLNFSTPPPSWLDQEYKSNRATRRKLERKWKKSSLPEDKTAYVQQRKLCSQMAKDKRRQYYSELISCKSGDSRALFSIMNKLFDKSKSSASLPQYDNAKDLANNFNDYYINKVQKIRNNIPESEPVNSNSVNNGAILESFRPTTVPELRKILKESGIKTSFHDILPAKVLKSIIEDLLPHFFDLVNKSLATGSVDGMKESVVIPLLKKTGLDPEILKNYRPVANLLFLDQLTQRVVFRRLDEHMHLYNLHCKYQHGYKKYHSTETLLVHLVNDMLLVLDSGSGVILLLIDLSAAFDTVDIDLMLHVLESEIGVTGLASQWFNSFLRNRSQRVLIENTLSDTSSVHFGVPQGSVLGPVLFNIYSSSLFKVIENCGFSTSGYADDNNARTSFALSFQYDLITKQLPHLMEQITNWMNSHFLKINPDKTEIIMFLPKHLKNEKTINGCFFEGDCIRFSNVVKNLGFKLDRFLSMEHQVDAIVSHCYKLICDVGQNRHLLSDKDTELLMQAMVSSRLDYCSALFIGVAREIIYKLQKVQNAAARLVAKCSKRESVREVLGQLHWLRVEERIIFKLLLLTFKCFHKIAPESLCNLITISSAEHFLLSNVYLDSTYGRRTFMYCAPRYWNALPLEIRSEARLESFKRLTKHLLFNNFSDLKRKAFIYN